MEEIILESVLRNDIGKNKVRKIRGEGFIPAVVYSEGKKSIPVKVERSKLLKFLHAHRAEGVVISLNVKDDSKQKNFKVMIKELQQDPVKEDIVHLDFHEISLTKVIKASVPIVTKGESAGVKQEGGSLEHILWEVEVECLPTDIPKEIVVDVSNLEIGDSIAIKDITFPTGVKVLHDPAMAVISVAAPIKIEEAVPAAAEEAVPQEPEVIKEKKEVPEEEAPAGKEKAKEEKK